MFNFGKRARQRELEAAAAVVAVVESRMQALHDVLVAEFRGIVVEELCGFAAKLGELLAPTVKATQEIEKSCRLLIDGQALVEKTINSLAVDEEARDNADESWRRGIPPVGGDDAE